MLRVAKVEATGRGWTGRAAMFSTVATSWLGKLVWTLLMRATLRPLLMPLTRPRPLSKPLTKPVFLTRPLSKPLRKPVFFTRPLLKPLKNPVFFTKPLPLRKPFPPRMTLPLPNPPLTNPLPINIAMVLVLQMTAIRGMMMNFMVVDGEEMELVLLAL